jgi:hypothetical protein
MRRISNLSWTSLETIRVRAVLPDVIIELAIHESFAHEAGGS